MLNTNRIIFVTFILMILCAPGFAAVKSTNASGRTAPASVRRELKSIMSAREYQVPGKSKVGKWFDKVLKPIQNVIRSFFKLFSNRPNFNEKRTGRIASYIFASIVVLAFLWLLAIVISRLMNSLGAEEVEDEGFESEYYQLPSARPLINEAAKLADRSDYRGAFRCAYLASISYLDEKKALRFERSRTNWEYLRELKSGGYELPFTELCPLTLAFDRKFYGREGCTYEDYTSALNAFKRISSEVQAS